MVLCRTNSPVANGNMLSRWPSSVEGWLQDFFALPASAAFPVDVREQEGDLIFEAELPGVNKDNVQITMENGVLTIAVNHPEEQEQNQGTYHLRERRRGQYSRSFRLGATADPDRIDAGLQDGILTVKVPTREEAKPRTIAVK